MCRMWLSFSNTHWPNSHGVSGFNVTWPKYTFEEPINMVFDAVKSSHLEINDFCAEPIRLLWDEAFAFSH
ncbi:hypothetical protein BO70DRAFT_6931 [Aspergillus heteromorphus CBS 117.55]|uniref:Uncharacterized protein n=1 Tax=Aspergillus heteromorphus CBS 117.55 TaxID=1448321 RepID=A0A317X450_9EURO|nr:uncharacterized protein BO70DRAFT_6931 [Aspergillus heteromorphus CBS 117.55]PWY92287.1 hypothetical protein BO70DRAFT_6931 [Aspergillus heteromorphus CBS 117.55]